MFGKIASLFVEVEPTPAATQDPKIPVPKTPVPAASTVPNDTVQRVTPQATPVQGVVNEEMIEFLAKAIEEANLDGFDYLEFRNALAAMASAPLSEQQKYAAVFVTASTMGLTKQTLLDSIDHYQSILNTKRDEFQVQVAQMTAQEVTRREELKAQKESEITSLSEQIREIQAAISAKQQESLEIDMELGQHKLNIQRTAASFGATYDLVSGKLQGDRQKIEAYIA